MPHPGQQQGPPQTEPDVRDELVRTACLQWAIRRPTGPMQIRDAGRQCRRKHGSPSGPAPIRSLVQLSRPCRAMVIMAHPPTAKGNLTLTSCRQASASPPHMDRQAGPHNQQYRGPARARYKALSAGVAEAPAGAVRRCSWVTVTSSQPGRRHAHHGIRPRKGQHDGRPRPRPTESPVRGLCSFAGWRGFSVGSLSRSQRTVLVPQKPAEGPAHRWDPCVRLRSTMTRRVMEPQDHLTFHGLANLLLERGPSPAPDSARSACAQCVPETLLPPLRIAPDSTTLRSSSSTTMLSVSYSKPAPCKAGSENQSQSACCPSCMKPGPEHPYCPACEPLGSRNERPHNRPRAAAASVDMKWGLHFECPVGCPCPSITGRPPVVSKVRNSVSETALGLALAIPFTSVIQAVECTAARCVILGNSHLQARIERHVFGLLNEPFSESSPCPQ